LFLAGSTSSIIPKPCSACLKRASWVPQRKAIAPAQTCTWPRVWYVPSRQLTTFLPFSRVAQCSIIIMIRIRITIMTDIDIKTDTDTDYKILKSIITFVLI
jgi:hypothetical protein